MTFEEVLTAIRNTVLLPHAEQLSELVRPSVRIRAKHADVDALPLGASRFGGVPDLPADVAWPTGHGKALSFLAQIRLIDVARLPESADLHRYGWLCFFYDADEQPWGFDPDDRGKWAVLHFDVPLDALERRAAPSEVPAFQACSIAFQIEHQLPDADVVLGSLDLTLTDEESAAYEELTTTVNGAPEIARHRMFGFPDMIQGDMRLECQLASNGINTGGSEPIDEARQAELEPGAQNWLLLLQLDDDDAGPAWMWGDCGRLYFWIQEDDFGALRLDRCWVILQCY